MKAIIVFSIVQTLVAATAFAFSMVEQDTLRFCAITTALVIVAGVVGFLGNKVLTSWGND